jgi:hypothetical protein
VRVSSSVWSSDLPGCHWPTAFDDRSFALWCLMKSPLIIGSDVRALPAASMAILKNKRLIAVNQDAAAVQVRSEHQTWASTSLFPL